MSMRYHEKQHQRAQFAFISEFCSNLEKNHEGYVNMLEDFKLDPGNKGLYREAQKWIESEVEMMRVFYGITRNPIFLWRAFANCVDGKLSFPQWIIDYFYDSAVKIVNAAYAYKSDKPDREKNLLSEALNFKSSGNKNNLSEWNKIFLELKEVSKVMRAKMTSDFTYEEIEAQVAADLEPDDEEEQTKIERRLKRWRQALQKIPEDLNL